MNFARITLRGNLVYENIETINPSKLGIGTYVAEQITFRCKDGIIIAPAFHVVCLQLNTHRKKFNNDSCSTIKYLTLSSDNVFTNICVLDKKYYGEFGVPIIFKPPMDQFVFACLHGMYLVNSFHIIQIIP
jgi:hypothetical protein